MARKPDFVIVGMPKSGTTALFRYLKDNPKIFVPERKEPHFFGTDLPDFQVKFDDLNEYLAIYDAANDDQTLGEASVQYLYSDVALAKLLEFKPDVKCIAVVRNPIDMARSWHNQCRKWSDEDVEDFEEAWDLQESRAKGENIPASTRDPSVLQYYDFCRVGSQLEKMIAQVPEKQRHIILYDDLKNNPRDVYVAMLDFLDVPDDGRRDFPQHNKAVEYKNKKLEEMTRRPGGVMKLLKKLLKKPLNAMGIHPSLALRKLNTVEAQKEIDPKFRKKLAAAFESEIKKVEEILGRDLSHWRVS